MRVFWGKKLLSTSALRKFDTIFGVGHDCLTRKWQRGCQIFKHGLLATLSINLKEAYEEEPKETIYTTREIFFFTVAFGVVPAT